MRITRINKMIKRIDTILIKAQVKIKEKIMNSRFCITENNAGMGVIEVILIILVLVGLALTFKSRISTMLNTIFSKINSKINSF